MTKFSAGIVAGFLLSWAIALAAPGVEHNGLFWTRLEPSAKAGYVSGYADAMQVSVGKLDNLMVAAELFHWKGARKIIHQVARELSLSDFRPEEAVKHLDKLYSNRKYSELDLGSALQLLAMRSSESSGVADNQQKPAN